MMSERSVGDHVTISDSDTVFNGMTGVIAEIDFDDNEYPYQVKLDTPTTEVHTVPLQGNEIK